MMESRKAGKEKATVAKSQLTSLLKLLHADDIDLLLREIEANQASFSLDEFLIQCHYLIEYACCFNCFKVVAALSVIAPQTLPTLAQLHVEAYLPLLHYVFEQSEWRKQFKANLPQLPANEDDLADKLDLLPAPDSRTLLDEVLAANFLADTTVLSKQQILKYDLLFKTTDRALIREKLIHGLSASIHEQFLKIYWLSIKNRNIPALTIQALILFSHNPLMKNIITDSPNTLYAALAPTQFTPPFLTPEEEATCLQGIQALLVLGLEVDLIIADELSRNESPNTTLFLKSGWSPFKLLLEWWDVDRAAFYKLFGLTLENQLEYLIIAARIVGKQALIDEVIAGDFSIEPFLAERDWEILHPQPHLTKEDVSKTKAAVMHSYETLQADLKKLNQMLFKKRPKVLALGMAIHLLIMLETIVSLMQTACFGTPNCHKEGDDQLVLESKHSFCLFGTTRYSVARNINCDNYNNYRTHPRTPMPDGTDDAREMVAPLLNLTDDFDVAGIRPQAIVTPMILVLSALIFFSNIAAIYYIRRSPFANAIAHAEYRHHSKSQFLALIHKIESHLELHQTLLRQLPPNEFTLPIRDKIQVFKLRLAQLRNLFTSATKLSEDEIMNMVNRFSTLISSLQKDSLQKYHQQLTTVTEQQWQQVLPSLEIPLLPLQHTQNNSPTYVKARIFKQPCERQPLLAVSREESGQLEEGTRLIPSGTSLN